MSVYKYFTKKVSHIPFCFTIVNPSMFFFLNVDTHLSDQIDMF